MINVASRNFLQVTTKSIPSGYKSSHISKPQIEKSVVYNPFHSIYSPAISQSLRVVTGIGVNTQVRFAHKTHNDLEVPDFGPYRRDSVKVADRKDKSSEDRKVFTGAMIAAAAVGATYGAKTIAMQYITYMGASADVLAMAKIEINLSDIGVGKSMTYKWRGKPLFVRHRTVEEIERESSVVFSSLRDPQRDSERVQRPEWLVIIGVCTHLGCVPIANAGDFGGYYCPCHGSHFDASGRIRKGPAPLNMEVPEYSFSDDSTLVVG